MTRKALQLILFLAIVALRTSSFSFNSIPVAAAAAAASSSPSRSALLVLFPRRFLSKIRSFILKRSSVDDNNEASSEFKPNAIVIGAGLAGLATSLGLVNAGFHVDLVEKRPDFASKGATFALAPNGIKALEEIDTDGVMTSLTKAGIDIGQIMQTKGYMLPWWTVRDALLERVRRRKGALHLHLGYTLHEIIDDPAAPIIQAAFRPAEGDENSIATSHKLLSLQGCIVVGADGVYSSLRQYLGCTPARKVGVTMWRGGIDIDPSKTSDPDHQALVPLLEQGVAPFNAVYGPTVAGVFNFHQKTPGRLAWSVGTQIANVPLGSNPWTAVLDPLVENDHDRKILKAVFNMADSNDFNYPLDMCVVEPPRENDDGKGWSGRGRIVLIGDAAHAMRSVTGLGGSMAFEDAVVLCRALKQVQEQGQWRDYDRMTNLVLHVENSRLSRVRAIWNIEMESAEKIYKDGKMERWTPEFMQWVYDGV